MADNSGMTLEERVDKLEAYFGANDEMVRELRIAVTATAAMEARQAEALKDHAHWLVAHDKPLIEQREFGKKLDERISALVSAIGTYISKH